MTGKKHSPEAREKMRKSRTGYRKKGAKPESAKVRGRKKAIKMYPLEGVICEICGKAKATDRHHKDQNTHNNRRRNLMFLCHPCHMRIENPQHNRKDR